MDGRFRLGRKASVYLTRKDALGWLLWIIVVAVLVFVGESHVFYNIRDILATLIATASLLTLVLLFVNRMG